MKRKTLLSVWLLITVLFSAVGQSFRYQASQKSDGTQVVRKESIPGSGVFDVAVSTLPSDAVVDRSAGRVLLPYAPEPKATVNFGQFGSGKYYSPTFKFCLDWDGYRSPNDRRAAGTNMFSGWNVRPEHKSQVKPGEGYFYFTQNGIGDLSNPVAFFTTPLQDFVNQVTNYLPYVGYGDQVNTKTVSFNFETTIFGLNPGNQGGPSVHPDWPGGGYFTNWDQVKDQPFVLEGSPGTTTLAQLASQGLGAWDYEMHVRRANRMSLICEITRLICAPGTQISIGYAPLIGLPDKNYRGTNGSFIDGFCNVQNVGGDTQGRITLNVPGIGLHQFTLDGDALKHQDFIQGYYYENHIDFNSQSDHDRFFGTNNVAKDPTTQNYPWLWANAKITHVVAENKAWIQLNRAIVAARTNSPQQGLLRQVEPVYEFNPERIPFTELSDINYYNGQHETPRPWVPPYIQYSIYQVTRFMAGNDPNWGFFCFPIDITRMLNDPATDYDLSGTKRLFGHELHPISAMYAARANMQPYEAWYTGSTLVENPEVQINQTGDWSAYDGADAYNYAGGTYLGYKPAHMLRYKAVPGGWEVLTLSGMRQGWTDEHTDLIRVPGQLGGNMLRIKVRGPASHVYKFFIKSTDTGQIYSATPTAVPSWELPGYAGRTATVTN